MKKTLLVLATLAATAGFAQAASVTLYGAADAGLVYTYSKVKNADGSTSTHQYGLESGNYGASKWGLKGEEDLGNGYKVSFKLENGYSLDDGRAGQGGRLFGREASLTVSGPFGALSVGRMGALTSGMGTYDIFQAYADVMDGGVNMIGAGLWNATDRYDNMLTYATPNLAGLTAYAQYSLQTSGSEQANERANNRYWAVGATFDQGPLGLVAVVDSNRKAKHANEDGTKVHDSYTISLGGNYDFGSFKLYAGAQYGENINNEFGLTGLDVDVKGYTAHLGAAIPLPCGELKASLWHTNGKVAGEDGKVKVYGVGLVHGYPLSKRTTFYSGVGATYGKDTTEADNTVKTTSAQVLFGLNHTF
ncbi:MAG: porin [Sutterella sp.]|nr:porin [Sutterella sp.]